jgi:hypothetical protein
MITWNRGAGILLLLFAGALAAPDYAGAQPPTPASGAVLYETTENMSLRALQGGHRKATSALLGVALRGTPLCPDELVAHFEPLAKACTLNATGADNISLATGLGQFGGTFTVVVQEVNPVTGNPTPDSPEAVIAKGRFTGKMDFSPAILYQIPFGSVDGHLSLDGFSKRVPFTGVFRLPFLYSPLASALCLQAERPLYLVDPANFGVPPTFGVSCVADNEMAIGYPTVKFEISF